MRKKVYLVLVDIYTAGFTPNSSKRKIAKNEIKVSALGWPTRESAL